jgi:hypothetical protein
MENSKSPNDSYSFLKEVFYLCRLHIYNGIHITYECLQLAIIFPTGNYIKICNAVIFHLIYFI